MRLTRRGLLAGTAAGGGLALAWALLPRDHLPPLAPAPGEVAFGAWLTIGRDGVVSVAVPQLEMGQGVTTLLPQIVALELGADWRQVAAQPAPVSGAWPNLPLAARWTALRDPLVPALADQPDETLLRRWARRHAFMATADGTTLPAYERPCREAAAAARAMLAMAAAQAWDVAWEECEAADGFIRHGARRARFGDLAQAAAAFDPPDPPPLRPDPPADLAPLTGSISGTGAGAAEDRALAFPRLDLPAKVDGSALFAGDVRLPGMVYAAIRHGPVGGAEEAVEGGAALASFDPTAAAGQRGLLGVVRNPGWLAAVASDGWAAERALDAMAPRFRLTDPASSARIAEALDAGLRRGRPLRVATRGAAEPWGEGATGRPDLALRYDIMPAAHGTIETASCTARLSGERLELWLATQAPEQARVAAAAALGLPLSRVVLYPVPAGGSFDRRLEHDHAVEAALIARAIGRPVQLTWSRWQEHLRLRPRPPAAAVLSARWAPGGQLAAFRAWVAMPPAALEFGRRLFAGDTPAAAIAAVAGEGDPLALEGLVPPYDIADLVIDHVPVRLPLPVGRLRGNAHGYTCFMVESFIDEAARRQGREPLAYRIGMLAGDLRLAHCLQRAARLAGWDGGGSGSAQGLACHRIEHGWGSGRIALVAGGVSGGVSGEGGIRVERLAAAVDIGRVVNRDIALQQIEGGLLYGLGLALGSGLDYQGGMPVQGGLAALNLPRLADSPAIAIDLIDSDADPFDPAELAVAPVAPAIANALFSATGLRLRRLPLLSPAA